MLTTPAEWKICYRTTQKVSRGVSHALGNTLTSLSGHLFLAAEKLGGHEEVWREVSANIAAMQEALQALTGLNREIAQFTDFEKLAEPVPCDLLGPLSVYPVYKSGPIPPVLGSQKDLARVVTALAERAARIVYRPEDGSDSVTLVFARAGEDSDFTAENKDALFASSAEGAAELSLVTPILAEIVSFYGGTLALESRAGETLFRLTLKKAPAP